MIVLFSFCDIPWWLTWLLPFLLGLGLGYLLWSRFKDMVASLEAKINELNVKIGGLEADLETCRKNRIEAEGNVSMLRGRLRELELEAAKASSTTHVGIAATTDHETKQSSESVSFAAAGSDDKWFATIGQDKLQQASLADQRKWNDLIALQKTLDTGRSDTATNGETDSKLEKWLIKAGVLRRWAQDDLKAVEGIGPKIEELMHAAGIKTWRALSETSVSRIQEILTAAGPRFALADPGTWPEQSGMAADGKWDELQKYQDFLNAGKVKKS